MRSVSVKEFDCEKHAAKYMQEIINGGGQVLSAYCIPGPTIINGGGGMRKTINHLVYVVTEDHMEKEMD